MSSCNFIIGGLGLLVHIYYNIWLNRFNHTLNSFLVNLDIASLTQLLFFAVKAIQWRLLKVIQSLTETNQSLLTIIQSLPEIIQSLPR